MKLIKTQNVALLTAKEKMPFQVTPFMLHLTREDKGTPAAQPNAPSPTPNQPTNTSANVNTARP
jgi:hypothetical protein